MASRTSMLSVVAAMVVMGASASADTQPEYCATGGPRLWANLEACAWPGSGNTGAVTNIRFLDNRFSTSQYPHGAANHSRCVGVWGTWFFRGPWPPYFGGPTDLWNVGGSLRSGNVVLETGRNIDRGGPDGCEGANTSPAPAGPITPPTAGSPASR